MKVFQRTHLFWGLGEIWTFLLNSDAAEAYQNTLSLCYSHTQKKIEFYSHYNPIKVTVVTAYCLLHKMTNTIMICVAFLLCLSENPVPHSRKAHPSKGEQQQSLCLQSTHSWCGKQLGWLWVRRKSYQGEGWSIDFYWTPMHPPVSVCLGIGKNCLYECGSITGWMRLVAKITWCSILIRKAL